VLKVDRFRVQYLEHLRESSKPVPVSKARTVANRGVGLSFDSQTSVVQVMLGVGWIKLAPNLRVFITMDGRAALIKMKKLFK
jgi:hypothetical protein